MTDEPDSLQASGAAHEAPIEQDLNHLRERALGHLMPGMTLLSWIAFIDATRARQLQTLAILTSALLAIGTVMAWLDRSRSPRKASLWLVLSMLGAFVCFVLTYPASGARFAAPIVLMLASTLFTTRGYAMVVLALAMALGLIQILVPDAVSLMSLIEAEAVLLASSVLLLLSRTHLYTALAWSGHSTERAIALTQALRDRQLRLNRSLKAMEEATSRIERMNRELVLAQHEAQIGRQAKSRFAATVSHEIRGPLNLILGFSRLLALSPERYGQDLTGDYYTDVDAIYRNAEHLSTLVEDVLVSFATLDPAVHRSRYLEGRIPCLRPPNVPISCLF